MEATLSASTVSQPPGIAKQKSLLKRRFGKALTVNENQKGVLDVDTTKGCTFGMKAYPGTGCYGLCYANTLAEAYGYDFPIAVSRKPIESERVAIERKLRRHEATWFRIGTIGDPCHDWENLVETCEWLHKIKTPVIVTKHWRAATDEQLARLAKCGAVFNTSVSAFDTEEELPHRLEQWRRCTKFGMRSLLRIVSCKFGDTENGRRMASIQAGIFAMAGELVIDNPLRIPESDPRVLSGDILVEKRKDIGDKLIPMSVALTS